MYSVHIANIANIIYTTSLCSLKKGLTMLFWNDLINSSFSSVNNLCRLLSFLVTMTQLWLIRKVRLGIFAKIACEHIRKNYENFQMLTFPYVYDKNKTCRHHVNQRNNFVKYSDDMRFGKFSQKILVREIVCKSWANARGSLQKFALYAKIIIISAETCT